VGFYRTLFGVFHGFIDRHGKLTTLSAPGAGQRKGDGTYALDINDSGVIVGWYGVGLEAFRGSSWPRASTPPSRRQALAGMDSRALS
jgi:hypothetical protein